MPKIVLVGRKGWLEANTKTKRKTTLKKVKKGHKNVKNENFEKRKKTFFSLSPKEHIFKKLDF